MIEVSARLRSGVAATIEVRGGKDATGLRIGEFELRVNSLGLWVAVEVNELATATDVRPWREVAVGKRLQLTIQRYEDHMRLRALPPRAASPVCLIVDHLELCNAAVDVIWRQTRELAASHSDSWKPTPWNPIP